MGQCMCRSQPVSRENTNRNNSINDEKAHEKDHLVLEAVKHKRAANILYGESLPDNSDFTKKVISKSDSEKRFIYGALTKHFLFTTLDVQERLDVINAMEKVEYEPNSTIINQGENGDYFYILQEGHCECYVDEKMVCEYNNGDGFGELALLYNAPRAASIKATTKCVLWMLDRQTFRYTLAYHNLKVAQDCRNAVKNVKLLESLTDDQITKLTQTIEIVQYKAGDTIIIKGETGQIFYIIKEGVCVCTDIGNVGGELELKSGDYFGERALLFDEPRAANVISKTDTTLMAIERKVFSEIIGPLKDMLENNIAIYVLRSLPQLSHCMKEEIQQLINSIVRKDYTEGEILCRSGVESDAFYIVKEGSVKCVYDDDKIKKNEDKEKIFKKGDYFNENVFVSSDKNAGTYTTLEKSTLYVISKDRFLRIIGSKNTKNLARLRQRRSVTDLSSIDPNLQLLPLTDYIQLRTLGAGTFGKVKLVRCKGGNGEIYAMKVLKKRVIVKLHQENNIMNEKNILMRCHHPFIQRLYATYKDQCALYMLIQFIQGGELFNLLWNKGGTVNIKAATFYSACVLSGLSYLHDQNILYRDLKPENLMIDRDGYIIIVDFGFAKRVTEKTYTLCGTPEYLAPELVVGKGHNKAVDYWALGILIYEMLCGFSPFADREMNRQMQICKNIMRGVFGYPTSFKSEVAKDLIKRLLEADPSKRLGCLMNGASDIKNHEFYKDIDWVTLENREFEEVPWKPNLTNELDTTNFDDFEDEVDTMEPFTGDCSWADTF